WATVREMTGIESRRLGQHPTASAAYQEFLNDPMVIEQWRRKGHYKFTILNICAAVQEDNPVFHHYRTG
ncbi:uncharacterized, partial [Tachysurus ichikawai]